MLDVLLVGSGITIIGLAVFIFFQCRVRRKRNYLRRQAQINRILIMREKRLRFKMAWETYISKEIKKKTDKQTVVVKDCFADAPAEAINSDINS